jgi:hypothetical protein
MYVKILRWFLLHDNASAHQLLVVMKYLARHNVTALETFPGLVTTAMKCYEKTIRESRGSHYKSDDSNDTELGKKKLFARSISKALQTLAQVCQCTRELLWRKCAYRCEVTYVCVINQFRELLKLLVNEMLD